MVIVGLLGIVFAIMGFFSGLEYGQFEAWLFATPEYLLTVMPCYVS